MEPRRPREGDHQNYRQRRYEREVDLSLEALAVLENTPRDNVAVFDTTNWRKRFDVAEAAAGLSCPFHDRDILVTNCGRICMQRKKINVSHVLAGQKLELKEVDDGIWLVSFMRYDLGYIDWSREPCRPSTIRSARDCHPCLRYNLLPMSPGRT